jgi:Fe-S cluster biogenesis protein NfuA
MTEAQVTDQVVRRHLAALILVAHEGNSEAIVKMMRSEMCRLVSAICTALSSHRLDVAGCCQACDSSHCTLLSKISRALLPVNLNN